MAEVVVVGAGVGGLAAAARLASLGHRVTVCEQAEQVGGKLGLHQHGGYRFDTGPSLVTLPQVFRALFDATGGPLDDCLDLVPVEPVARYRFADGTWLDTSADLNRFSASLDEAFGAGTGDQWRAFLARAGRIWSAVEGPFLNSPLTGWRDLARQSLRLRDLATIAPWQSLRDIAAGYLRDERLRTLADRYATYTGSDPRRAPAALAAVPYAEQAFGAWYVRGGLYRLGEAIADRAREQGAVVRTHADVAQVETSGGKVSGVTLSDGEYLVADVVVANADAAHLYGDLLHDRRTAAARRRLARADPSLSGFVVLLGVEGRTPGLAHHTVLFPADYDAEFDALFGPEPRPVADPTLYLAVPPDPAAAPQGHEAWFLLVNAPRQGQGDVDWTTPGVSEAYADRLLALLAERGIEVRDRVHYRTVISPADLATRTRATGGAIYGTSSNGAAAAFLRPANRSLVPGLFLVGGSSHPGGGLPLVVLSAAIVATLIGPA